MKKVEDYKLKKGSKLLKVYKKMEKAIIKFGDNEIEKHKFHQYKRPISIKKVSFGKKGFKYFIGYKDAKKIRPLCIFLPKWVHIEETLMNPSMCLF